MGAGAVPFARALGFGGVGARRGRAEASDVDAGVALDPAGAASLGVVAGLASIGDADVIAEAVLAGVSADDESAALDVVAGARVTT